MSFFRWALGWKLLSNQQNNYKTIACQEIQRTSSHKASKMKIIILHSNSFY